MTLLPPAQSSPTFSLWCIVSNYKATSKWEQGREPGQWPGFSATGDYILTIIWNGESTSALERKNSDSSFNLRFRDLASEALLYSSSGSMESTWHGPSIQERLWKCLSPIWPGHLECAFSYNVKVNRTGCRKTQISSRLSWTHYVTSDKLPPFFFFFLFCKMKGVDWMSTEVCSGPMIT